MIQLLWRCYPMNLVNLLLLGVIGMFALVYTGALLLRKS